MYRKKEKNNMYSKCTGRRRKEHVQLMYRKKKKRTCTFNVQKEEEKISYKLCTRKRRKEHVS